MIASDGAGDFEVVGESRAGEKDPITVTSGKVAYITTGVCCDFTNDDWWQHNIWAGVSQIARYPGGAHNIK